MTDEQHMQKARALADELDGRWQEDWPPIIASALSEAYRSGVEAERERAAAAAEGSAREFDFQKAMTQYRDWEAGYQNGRIAAATAIRKA
jgi:hypothetical protein